MYGENQIIAAMINTLDTAVSEMGVVGFEVMARNPQNRVTGDSVILLDKLDTRRIGFQGRAYRVPDGVAERKVLKDEEWIEEIVFQVSALRQRKVSDGVNTVTQDDAIEKIQAWFNSSRAALWTRQRTDIPFAIVHTSQKRTIQYQDASEVSQRSSQIDIRIQVVQRITTEEPDVWPIGHEVHGV